MRNFNFLSALLSLPATTLALNNGFGRTPPLGFNSWYSVRMSPSATDVFATAAALESSGLQALGYTHVNLDDGIVEVGRDANGDLIPDKTGFPNGFKVVSDALHASNFTFGVYTDRGPLTCGGRAAAQGHEAQDARFYAANGVDYVKEDSWWVNKLILACLMKQTTNDALTTGLPSLLSLSPTVMPQLITRLPLPSMQQCVMVLQPVADLCSSRSVGGNHGTHLYYTR